MLTAFITDNVIVAYTESIDEYSADCDHRTMKITDEFMVKGYYRLYDGSHQTFPGLDMKVLDGRYGIKSVYPSQRDCVWMLLLNGGGICDHSVGTGNTLIMCMAAHENNFIAMVRSQ